MSDQYNYQIERIRFHLEQKNTLIVSGWFQEDNPQNRTIECYLDQNKLDYDLEVEHGVRIRQRYLMYHKDIGEEVIVKILLPEHWEQFHSLKIITKKGSKSYPVTKVSISALKKKQKHIDYRIEQVGEEQGRIRIQGWAIGREPVTITVFAGKEQLNKAAIKQAYRRDVMEVYGEGQAEYQAGFLVETAVLKNKPVRLVFQGDGKITIYRTSWLMIRCMKLAVWEYGCKMIASLKKEGFASTWNKVQRKLFRKNKDFSYDKWLKKHTLTSDELQRQKLEEFQYKPRFSFVVPLYKTNERFLRELIDSIAAQTYGNWEICFADGSGGSSNLRGVVEEYQKKALNIQYKLLEKNGGIAGNTNAALGMAQGDFIVLADHDDLIAPNALYECVKALSQDPTIDVLYSDEDKVDMTGKKFFEPHFKSDYNVDLLCSMNYICHLFVVKNEVLQQAGGMKKEFEGAQDHDFILRCCETAGNICHIPRILYHWRCHINSTAENPESKLYAFEAGRRAVEEHYKRLGIPAVVEHSSFYGMFRTRYRWQEQPLVSIVIPNKDHIDDLKKCMGSIDERSSYRNYEFVIVENNSTEDETFAYYRELEQQDNVTVLYYKGGFNFSRINNFGVEHARGEYILLLNNDTEIINPDCIWELLGVCMREDVGIAGAKLCYGDDTIQHAGVVIGFGGMAGHTFIGASRYDLGYMGRIACAQDYSAVTAACLMTKKAVYQKVEGLTEEFEVAFNDIDYCLKVRELGLLVVYNPYAELYHYESKSRGLEDTPEKIERFNSEVARLAERWHDLMHRGDPYYNVNLTLDRSDFSLKM